MPHTEPHTASASLFARFTRIAQQSGAQAALICEGQTISYGQLANMVENMAAQLAPQLQGSNYRVLLKGHASAQMIVCMLAVMRVGGVFIALDLNSAASHITQVIEDAKPACVIDCSHIALPDPAAEMPMLPPFEPNSDIAYIYYTSGTSGKPKGIVGLHRSLDHFIQWQGDTFQVSPNDRVAQLTSPGFDVYLREVFLPLTNGAALVIPAPGQALAPDLLSWLEKNQISLLHSVPSLLSLWLNCPDQGESLRCLRYIFSAGEPLSGSLVQRYRARFAQMGRFINLYGPTETTLAKFYHLVCEPATTEIQPVGHALPDSSVSLITADGSPAPLGHVGEIIIHTRFGSAGYLNQAPHTSSAFVFAREPGHISYATGDLGYLDRDGRLVVLGRKDRQIKLNGVRIEPEGIAGKLQHCPQISQLTVRVLSTPSGKPGLVVYWCADSEHHATAEKTLRDYAQQHLPQSHQACHFVRLDRIPLTARGKTDFTQLPNPFLSAQLSEAVENSDDQMSAVPRLADGAIAHLERLFAKPSVAPLKVLEFGMGGSTLWFARHTTALVSIENHADWYRKVRASLAGHPAELILMPLPLSDYCQIPADESFDIILIDNEDFDEGRMRYACFAESLRLLKPGGTILFDNIDRPKFSQVYTLMAEYNWEMGLSTNHYAKPGYNEGSQTAWWIKPGTASLTPEPDPSLSAEHPLAQQWQAIWQKVLGRPVSLSDHLQDLGADSVQILEIAHLGYALLPNRSVLFQNPTIQSLLQTCAAPQAATAADEAQAFPLLPTQRDILALLSAEAFVSPVKAFAVAPTITPEMVEQAWCLLTQAQPVLRTSLDLQTQQQYFASLAEHSAPLQRHRINTGFAANSIAQLARLVEQHSTFQLEGQPLYRLLWLECDAYAQPLLILLAHHVLLDGRSWQILLQQFQRILQSLQTGAALPTFPSTSAALRTHADHLLSLAQDTICQDLTPDQWVAPLPSCMEKQANWHAGYHRSTGQLNPAQLLQLQNSLSANCTLADKVGLTVLQVMSQMTGQSEIVAEWLTDGVSDGPSPMHDVLGCLYRCYPVNLRWQEEWSFAQTHAHFRQAIARNRYGLLYSCRRWLHNDMQDAPAWDKIKPLFTFNFSVETVADDPTLPLTPIDRPAYQWGVNQDTLSQQITIPLRFFFYLNQGGLHGYVLGRAENTDQTMVAQLMDQVFECLAHSSALVHA